MACTTAARRVPELKPCIHPPHPDHFCATSPPTRCGGVTVHASSGCTSSARCASCLLPAVLLLRQAGCSHPKSYEHSLLQTHMQRLLGAACNTTPTKRTKQHQDCASRHPMLTSVRLARQRSEAPSLVMTPAAAPPLPGQQHGCPACLQPSRPAACHCHPGCAG